MLGFLLGWPSVGLAVILAIAGVWLKKPALLWIALVLSAPTALYISLTPRLPAVGIIPLGSLVIAALTSRKDSRWPSILAVTVYVTCVAALANMVIGS